MREDLEQLKQRIPLLPYLQRRHWTGCRVAAREEFVGRCPLHRDTRPSFYVNARKNLFYCHGCQCGGDLIRFVELSERLTFRESLACLKQDLALAAESELLTRTTTFYQMQLHRCSEAVEYLQNRGLQDPDLIEELGLGYAPGGNLRRHLADFGYSLDLLLRTGLINHQGRDAFCRRVIFPCYQQGGVINLYGRSIGAAFPHRLLPRGAWANSETALYDEFYAHLVGDALPVAIGRFIACKHPRVHDKAYRERRTRSLGHSPVTSALDAAARLERIDSSPLAERYFPERALAWRAVEQLRTAANGG